jgi:hypothetical protein
MTIGIEGGFAAQFQLAASKMMRNLAVSNFSMPIVITGSLMGYSNSPECAFVDHEWICYFLPTSTCHSQLVKTGIKVHVNNFDKPDEEAVPPIFRSQGLPFWWGVIQFFLFRFQPSIEKLVAQRAQEMLHGLGFPHGLPIAGLHVRHGDKHNDGFHEYSLGEELSSIRKSLHCPIQNVHKACFVKVNFSDSSSSLWLGIVMRGLSIVLPLEKIDQYNASLGVNHQLNQALRVDVKTLLPYLHIPHSSPGVANNIHQNDSHIPLFTSVTYVLPLAVFVASDDPSVLSLSQSLGLLTLPQSTLPVNPSQGMFALLAKQPKYAFNASLEIFTDIFLLSQCSSLVGGCSSQVFRMAVAISNVTNTLVYSQAMDMNQYNQVKKLSNKYRIPFPENFSW